MYGFIVLLGWIIGISTMGNLFSSSILSIAPWLWAFSSIAIVFFILKLNFTQNVFFRIFYILCLGLSSFFIGQSYADHALEQRLSNRIQDIAVKSEIVYIDKIDERSNAHDQESIKQKVSVVSVDPEQNIELLLYLKSNIDQQSFELGRYYQVTGKVKPAHSYAVDGVFDQEKWLIQQNIMGTMQVQQVQALSEHEIKQLGFTGFVKKQHTWISSIQLYAEKKRISFREYIQKQPLNNKGLLLALLTGDESLLSKSTQDQFKTLGISHLLAISGPHVLIFAVIFCFFINTIVSKFYPTIFLRIPRPYFLVIPFLCCVLAYTAFVGFEIPAMRTCLTVCLISLVLLLKQNIQALKLLLLSASLLLLLDPFSILSAAFWLSYGACFILIRVYQTIVQESKDSSTPQIKTLKSKSLLFIRVLIDSQWKVFVALFPLVALIFQQVSWISPLINLIAIPMIGTIVVPLEVIGACISGLSEPIGILFFYLADWAVSFLLACLGFLQNIFHPKLTWLAISPWMIFSIAIGVSILFLPRGVVPKAWALICFLPFLLGAKSESDFELTVLDVGQGQAIFLNLPNQKLMIDTGGYYDEEKFSVGKQIILPYLMSHGISHLDKLILSHLDQDHAGAFQAINQEVKIDEIYSNQNDERFDGMNFKYCHEGQHWQFDGINVQVLAPTENSLSYVQNDQNELSCVIYIQVPHSKGDQNFLIMGDVGWKTEYEILQKYPNLKVDVLILGHHGSQHSSSFGFLEQLKPKLTIASAGFDNRYNHPSPIVLARLDALSIPFESTVQKGSIQFKLNKDKGMMVLPFRETRKWLIRD